VRQHPRVGLGENFVLSSIRAGLLVWQGARNPLGLMLERGLPQPGVEGLDAAIKPVSVVAPSQGLQLGRCAGTCSHGAPPST